MNTGTFSLNLNPELISMPDYLRRIQMNLAALRRHHPVSLKAYGLHRVLHLGIFPAHLCEFFQDMDQLIFTGDFLADHLAEHFIIIGVIHIQHNFNAAVRHIYGVRFATLHVFAFHGYRTFDHIPDAGNSFHKLRNLRHNILFHAIRYRQHFHPFRHIKFHNRNGELIQDFFQNLINIFLFQLFAVHRHGADLIFCLQLLYKLFSLLRKGPCGI